VVSLEFLAPSLAYQLRDRVVEIASLRRNRIYRIALGSAIGSSFRAGTVLNRHRRRSCAPRAGTSPTSNRATWLLGDSLTRLDRLRVQIESISDAETRRALIRDADDVLSRMEWQAEERVSLSSRSRYW
jgi:hypothetical protein